MPLLSNLRAVREQRALSQAELGRLVGMSQPALSTLERGVRGAQPRTMRKLAKALKVDPAELLGGRDRIREIAPHRAARGARQNSEET